MQAQRNGDKAKFCHSLCMPKAKREKRTQTGSERLQRWRKQKRRFSKEKAKSKRNAKECRVGRRIDIQKKGK